MMCEDPISMQIFSRSLKVGYISLGNVSALFLRGQVCAILIIAISPFYFHAHRILAIVGTSPR